MRTPGFPAAVGFLASVRFSGGGRVPGAAFAALGSRTDIDVRPSSGPSPQGSSPAGSPPAGTLDGLSLTATLVHHPDVAPEGALARDERTATAVLLAGELYDRTALRSVLPASEPVPDTDAALLLALLRRYGPHAFRLLNGRFAAVVRTGTGEDARVLLATDHAGSVPLYARVAPGEVTAATEAKTLAPGAGNPPAPGLALPEGRPVPGLPYVHQVPAGTWWEIRPESGALAAHRTWEPAHSRRIVPEEEAVAAVRAALEKAVATRVADGDTPLVVLSGGIDSSSVAACAHKAAGTLDTVSMGTDTSDEFAEARAVVDHLGTRHREITVPTADLLAQLPYAVWAAESVDPDIIEYLLPLTALYRALGGPPRRILTGYGADIPLAGMHREDRLPNLDTAVAFDMATFDGLNEMSPVLSALGGHWTTHPYWDRDVLDLLVPLEAGLKRRYGRDKWVLREALADALPEETVHRPKLGVHEGSGTTSSFSRLLAEHGVAEEAMRETKRAVVRELFELTVVAGRHPSEVSTAEVVRAVVARAGRETS
ncbi:asparagine synthase family protein [Streptomyces sp. NPDC048718]|uniref:asparagine synthase family protein n=1 Tax=Streptomyces sp. NPDC048718 TaxID=3365587 RepID=UPI003715428D